MGKRADSRPSSFHTALALLALSHSGTAAVSELVSARDYLLSFQYPEGSWGAVEPGQDTATVTATVLEALLVSGTPPFAPGVGRARDWLMSHQNADGGWGVDASCPAATALVLSALRWVGGWPEGVAPRAAGYLEGAQAADGSWEEDPWTTALAVSALSSSGAPDLCFAPGGVVPAPDPIPGDRWQLAVAAANHGTVAAAAVSLRLRLTDGSGAEVFSEEKALEGLAPGGVGTVSFAVDTATLSGRYDWSVQIDSADAVREGDEANNLAVGSVDVGGTRRLSLVAGSLRIFTTDGLLELSAASLSAGTPVVVKARLLGEGTRATGPVEVWFYWGDPANGVFLGSVTAPALPAGGQVDVSVPWTIGVASGPGSLVAVLDPRGLVAQTAEGVARSDLPAVVASADTVAPAPPPGLTATLIARDRVDVSWQPSPSPDVVGYRLWRDGIPVHAADLASVSTPSASASYNLREALPESLRLVVAFDPSNLIDADPETSWWSIRRPYEEWEPEACYVQFDFASPRSVRVVVIQWYHYDVAARDFRVQAWNGLGWENVAIVNDNLQERSVLVLPASVVTNALRIRIDKGLSREGVAIREVNFLEGGPGRVIQGTASVDTTLAAVPARYTVTAVDAAGNESVPSEPFVLNDLQLPMVRLTAPLAGERVGPDVPIVGTVTDDFLQGYALDWAEGDYVDGDPAEWRRALERAEPVEEGGLFTWHPPANLDGPVTLRLSAVDGGGIANAREQRVKVWVDTVPPAEPAGLVSSLDVRRLTLRWRANAEPDLAGYRVVLNGTEEGLGDVARNGTASASASYSDAFGERAPGLALDGDRGSYWRPPEDAYPCWWAVDFPIPQSVRRVVVTWRAPMVARRFRVESRDGAGVWVPRWSSEENLEEEVEVEFLSALPVLGVRVVVLDSTVLVGQDEGAPGHVSDPPPPIRPWPRCRCWPTPSCRARSSRRA